MLASGEVNNSLPAHLRILSAQAYWAVDLAGHLGYLCMLNKRTRRRDLSGLFARTESYTNVGQGRLSSPILVRSRSADGQEVRGCAMTRGVCLLPLVYEWAFGITAF